MRLAGKVALVTGAGGGIGGGIGEALAEKGAKVILTDSALDRCEAKAAQIGGAAMALPHDVTSLESWAKVRAAALDRFGQVDVLRNNAGVSVPWVPLTELPPEQFDLALRVNLYGVFNGVHTFGRDMIARKSGHIVNMSSFNGIIPTPLLGAYGTSKFGVTVLTATLRAEMAPHGVGVSGIYPGLTRSIMVEELMEFDSTGIMKDMPLMEPIWVGRAVAKAIESNAPHVMTHPSLKPAFDAWCDELNAAFGEGAQPDLPV